MRPSLPTRWLAALAGLFFLACAPLRAQTIRLSFPPDPNALPVFVLQAKQKEWLPQDKLELKANPSGDPSAMRAMIASGDMDYALFNLVGGVRFVQGGMRNVHLVSPWVWRGIYLLTPVDSEGRATALSALQGKTVAVSPGLSTPPQIVTQKALQKIGVKADFIAAGSGTVLMNLLRDPSRAPAGFAAAEPMVSQVLLRQQQENWPVRWAVALDPTQTLGTEIPLGALWQIGNSLPAATRERFVAALRRAAQWANDPRNQAEAARIAAKGYADFFRQPVPPQAFENMLQAHRVVWRMDDIATARPVVERYLKDVFGIAMPPALFITP
ncbi:ABC transporter substrate-binding protein [Thiomonas sp.]